MNAWKKHGMHYVDLHTNRSIDRSPLSSSGGLRSLPLPLPLPLPLTHSLPPSLTDFVRSLHVRQKTAG